MNRVEISLEGVEPPSWKKNVSSFVCKALCALGRDNWELSVLFCGADFIRGLNGRYRNRDEATDVLSFSLGGYDGKICLPGDIVISLDGLYENAERFSVSPDEELRRLLVHGILHLDGMDHADNNPEEPMLKKQEALLEELSAEHIISEV